MNQKKLHFFFEGQKKTILVANLKTHCMGGNKQWHNFLD